MTPGDQAPVDALSLGVDKRRGEEAPVEVLRVAWTKGGLPSRDAFFDLIQGAYGKIELPYFPSNAFVVVETETRRETIVCGEPVDRPYWVAIALWNGFQTAMAGEG